MTTVSAAFVIAFALVIVAYAIMMAAKAIGVMTEQMALGVRLTESAAPSAQRPDAPPEAGVVAWPDADGWRMESPPPPVPDTVPQWKDADAVDTKARTSDNNHPQASADIDENPELRGRRGSVQWP